ncbi:winged helix DNA-binding domain-containing protein [Blastococcus sp. PRF04-17]|uniref:winged helix DNA-binding domain-containing protein n=1 Tax=Blastococcus sp. PRF04-17 TaxID=2933797 RepID=UPI001FF20DDE|nr:winged helix DNA-binding domain-containing protein [Blastococcus sp. PRF04-17]UOY03556.1 winged helix DNA-binding domain-containing protein [Blastococcus sp. PRF04-17]
MTTSLRDLGLLRLAALRLVGPGEPTAADAVRVLGAVQAQDYPGALTSVALRTASRLRKDVVAALDSGAVVRSWPMRGTLHFVAAEDLRWFLDTVGVRMVSTVSRRWADLGLDEAHAERARELVDAALSTRGRLSRAELLAAIADGGVEVTGQRGAHLIGYLALTGTTCLGPTDGEREQLFVRLVDWVPDRRLEREQALAELALRFFTGHGPATVPDLVRWAGSTVRDVRTGLAAVRDRLESVTVEGTEYLMDPATPGRLAAARAEAEGLLLLPGFDEFVLGYGDRTAVLPAEFAERIVPGNNGMFRPTVVHGGQVVATWRWTGRGATRAVAVEPFRELPDDAAAAIPGLAAQLP